MEAVERATTPLFKRIQSLEADLAKVSLQANENEQYTRKYKLRFVGLNETEGEDCVDKIVSFCKEKLDIDIDTKGIYRAHYLGPKDPDRARPMIIKFK